MNFKKSLSYSVLLHIRIHKLKVWTFISVICTRTVTSNDKIDGLSTLLALVATHIKPNKFLWLLKLTIRPGKMATKFWGPEC